MKKMLVLFCTMACLIASSETSTPSGRLFQIKTHDVNNVEMCVSNYGKFGQDESGNAGCWWPFGSNHNYIYGAGVWFGTVDFLTGDTLVTIGYDPHYGASECAPGLKGMDPNDPMAIIYMYPDNWPAPAGTFPMAPQAHISHQDSWCCFNDCDSLYHMPGDTRPIGIGIYQTVYAWNFAGIEDVIFFIYDLKNVADHNLQDCYFGVVTDCDIGNESGGGNDIMSGIVGKWYVVDGESIWVDNLAYQYQTTPEATWAEFPGAIGFDLLQTQFDLEPGQDKDGDGILDQYERDSAYYYNMLPDSMWDVDNDGVPDWRDASENPQLGMTALKRFTLSFEPSIDAERYLTLAGYNYQTGFYEPYDTVPSPPDDQRFLMSSGPFDLGIDSSVTIVFAVVLANWHGLYSLPDTALALVDKWAQYQYDNNWILSVKEMPKPKIATPLMTISPNPITKQAHVSFALPTAGLMSLKIYNTVGQLVKEVINGDRSVGAYNVDLNLTALTQGTYLLLLETPNGKSARSLVIVR